MAKYVICINNFVESRLTSVTLLASHFQYKKAGFLYLINYWMKVVHSKFVAYWEHQNWNALSWKSLEFSAFLIFAVWTSSMTYLTFAKGELQTANHFLPYIHTLARVILFPITLYFYFANSQKLMHWAYNVSLWQN